MNADPPPEVDLTPATAVPPSVMQGVHQEIGLRELADDAINYRTREEES